jgi:pyridoxal phosphate enzyme (YggS family)
MQDRLSAIQARVHEILSSSRRPIDAVRIIAVSKTQSALTVRQAYECGLRDFGENYADELADKAEELGDLKSIRWIFIGQLQSNKIQKIVRYANEIQSIASEKHARYIERYVAENGRKNYPVWININAAGEDSKQGVSFADLPPLAAFIQAQCPHLDLQGIMAIPPPIYSDERWKQTQEKIPDLYMQLRSHATKTGRGLLSLGMTSDLELAIRAGSNCVRIGTALFGPRSA